MVISKVTDCFRLCMVRRVTARVNLVERQVCGNVFGLLEPHSPGQDGSAACLSLQIGRPLKTIIGSRLRARRCDCSFVITVLVQTLVGKVVAVLSHAAVMLTAGR